VSGDKSHPILPQRVVLFQNPKAGARSGRPLVGRLESLLQERGHDVQTTSDVDQYVELVASLNQDGDSFCVVAAGGDGTVGLVVNHSQPGTPIAILPLGTENLLAKQLGITADSELVCRMICDGELAKIDAGEANGRLFLLMVGCGFDADVVQRLHRERKGHIHRLSYFKPIFDSVRSYEYPGLRVYCDPPTDEAQAGSSGEVITAKWAFVVNLPRYAGGLQIAPRAVGDDQLLDVCTFQKGSLLSGLRYLAGIALGHHEGLAECTTFRVRRLRIESDGEVPYQLDGDPGGTLPVDIRVLPQRATLLVPRV
jgi:diacylglycerol kinase (ATP)